MPNTPRTPTLVSSIVPSRSVLALLAAMTVGALCQLPWAAHAQEEVSTAQQPLSLTPERPPADRPLEARRWFGWQTLAVDLTSIGLIVAGGAADQPAIAVLGGLGYLALSPIVLAVHASDWALPSLLLRTAVPVLMFVGVLIAFNNCPLFSESSCDATGGLVVAGAGFLLGVSMPVVDAALAFETPKPAPRAGLAITPWLTARSGAAGLALSGRM